jgi:hypothetical protein
VGTTAADCCERWRGRGKALQLNCVPHRPSPPLPIVPRCGSSSFARGGGSNYIPIRFDFRVHSPGGPAAPGPSASTSARCPHLPPFLQHPVPCHQTAHLLAASRRFAQKSTGSALRDWQIAVPGDWVLPPVACRLSDLTVGSLQPPTKPCISVTYRQRPGIPLQAGTSTGSDSTAADPFGQPGWPQDAEECLHRPRMAKDMTAEEAERRVTTRCIPAGVNQTMEIVFAFCRHSAVAEGCQPLWSAYCRSLLSTA